MSWVLDTSAVICWLKGEVGFQRVEDVLAGQEPSFIHAVNFVEVQYYLLGRGEHEQRLGVQRMELARLRVDRNMDDELLAIAVALNAYQAPIALGDVFGVALASQRGATLLTTDRGELEKVAAAGLCQIEFLR